MSICPSSPPDPTEHEEAPPEEPGVWGEPQVADPCDMGRLLKGALAATTPSLAEQERRAVGSPGYVARMRNVTGITQAEMARRIGVGPASVYKAINDPNTHPQTARRILRACGLRLALAPEEKDPRGA